MEGVTFVPKINRTSKMLAKKRSEPVEERLMKSKAEYMKKRSEKSRREEPTFQPKLNEKTREILKQRDLNAAKK